MRTLRNTAIGLALFPTLILFSMTATAADLPKRKSGLWQISTKMEGMPSGGSTVQHCIDSNTDNMMQQSIGETAKNTCTKQEIRQESNRVVVESVCKMGDTTATTRAIFTGKFESGYKGEIHSTYNPPMMGKKESNMVIEAKWLGACKSGQQPGDMILPNGMKINPGQMPGRK